LYFALLCAAKSKKKLEHPDLIEPNFYDYFKNLSLLSENEVYNSLWFNAIIHRIFYYYYKNPVFINEIFELIQKKISRIKTPGFIGLQLKGVTLGNNCPTLNDVKVKELSPFGSMMIVSNLNYNGGFEVEIEANIDVPLIETINGSLFATVNFLNSKFLVSWCGYSDRFWIGFDGEPDLQIDMRTHINTKSSKVNISQIADIIKNLLKRDLVEKMVFPDMEDIHLPILDKKNTKKYANVNYGYAPGVIINEPVIVESNIPEPIPENIPVQPEAPIPEEKKSDITEVPQLVAKEEIKLEPAENIWDMVTNIFTKSRENDIPIVVENEKKKRKILLRMILIRAI